MQPRRLLVEYFGAFVRRLGDWTSSRAVVSAMASLGVDEPATRTTLSRLKSRDWIQAERRQGLAGHRLTQHALRAYESGDEVIWQARRPAALADGWCVVSVSVPESRRATRQALRSRLSGLGFGNTQPGTWVAPASMAASAATVLDELDVTAQADRFVAHYDPPERVHDLVARGWDLRDLDEGYRDFVATFEADVGAATITAPDDEQAYVLYMRALNHWRTLAFRDPGLPLELMPADWHGETARTVFEAAMGALDAPALRFVSEL